MNSWAYTYVASVQKHKLNDVIMNLWSIYDLYLKMFEIGHLILFIWSKYANVRNFTTAYLNISGNFLQSYIFPEKLQPYVQLAFVL